VFSDLVVVNGVYNDPIQPERFAWWLWHELSGKFA
jgi:hypothetical protein